MSQRREKFMHDCVSGLVGQHTVIILCKPVCKRQRKEEREQRDNLLLSMHVLESVCVCVLQPSIVYCQPASQ